MINSFVDNIYQSKYEECKAQSDIDIEDNEFKSIMKSVRDGLEDGYINTRIVSYKKEKNMISIYGGVWTKNEILDLFQMQLKDTENGLRIVSFGF